MRSNFLYFFHARVILNTHMDSKSSLQRSPKSQWQILFTTYEVLHTSEPHKKRNAISTICCICISLLELMNNIL
jgi:hypothetical protein